MSYFFFFFFSSRRRHTRSDRDWSSDVCSSDLDACDEGGFAWDDTNNNRAFLAGEISATLNGASIYIAAKRGQEKIKDDKGEPMVRDIQHGPIPNGPAGTYGYHVAFSH